MSTSNETQNLKNELNDCRNELNLYRRNVPPWKSRVIFAGILVVLTGLLIGWPICDIYCKAIKAGEFNQVQLIFLTASLAAWAAVVLGALWYTHKMR